jgi:hypothetical protein
MAPLVFPSLEQRAAHRGPGWVLLSSPRAVEEQLVEDHRVHRDQLLAFQTSIRNPGIEA